MRSDRAAIPTEGPVPGTVHVGAGPKLRSPRRLSSGSIVPILLAVLAAGFGYEALQDRSAMTSIVVSREAIPAGAALDAANTRAVRVHASDQEFTNGVLGPSQLAPGLVAAVALPSGEPITLSEVKEPATGPALGQMSVAVPLQQAAGGAIAPGDRVDVIAANGQGGANYVAQDLRVISVAPTSVGPGVLGGQATDYFIVVAVTKQDALKLAAALGAEGTVGGSGQVQVVLSTGERPTADVVYGSPSTASSSSGAQR